MFMNKGVFMFDIFDAQLAFLSITHSILVQFPKFSFGTKLAAIAILQTIEFTVAHLLLSPMMNNFGFNGCFIGILHHFTSITDGYSHNFLDIPSVQRLQWPLSRVYHF